MFFVRAGREGKGTTAHRRHHQAKISTDNQRHNTAQHGATRQATGGQSKQKQHPKTTAEHDSTAPRDSIAPQNTTQGSKAPQQTAATTGKQATRLGSDTNTETRHQKTTTGHQTQHRTS